MKTTIASTSLPTLLLALVAATALMACGGGGDAPPEPAGASAAGGGGGGGSVTLACDTTHYSAGAVELPTAAQLSAYAGTYDGDEGSFGPNPGDPFVKSGSATMVFGADGSFSYKSIAYAVTSVCVDKVANGTGSKFLYVEAGKGLMDITDLASAHGFSPADGATLFQNGKKR